VSTGPLLPGSTRLCLAQYYVLTHETVILIVRPEDPEPVVVRRNLGSAALAKYAARLVDDFAAENINPSHPEWTTDLDYLRPIADELIGPVREHLANVDVLYIIPHGHLFYFPFHAFPMSDGSYLIDHKPLAYIPSTTLLLNARLARRSEQPARFLGIGTGSATDPGSRRQDFENEIEALAALHTWNGHEKLLGNRAIKKTICEYGSNFDVIHFACHGRFNADDPFDSALECADSLLTAREIAELKLKAHLVYLSACVSGRHDIQPGDEILGLTRAFIRAGAACLVGSLWPISGFKPTRLLMECFYDAWLVRKQSKVEAMQFAQIEVKKRFAHPYHWAPFVLVGDWA
jgi:CHAT domain-containing protein